MNRVKLLVGEFFMQTKSELDGIRNEFSQFKLLRQDIKSNIKKNSHYYFFILLMLLGLMQLYICINLTNGECIKEFLFESPAEPFADMFMDYFNPIRSLYMENPYTKINAIYPPVNYLLLSIFYKSIPTDSIIPDLGGDYYELLSMRNSREAMFSYFAYCFLAVLILITIINKLLRKHNIKLLFLFDVAVLFSWGFLFTFDRGNFLFFTVASILLFFYLDESESRIKQELGLVALALAVCMKIYPVFLSLYLLTQKKYSQFVRFVLYCVLIFFSPFVFYGGTESIVAIIKNIFVESGKIGSLYPGGNISFQNCIYLMELLTGSSNGLTAFLKNFGPVIIIVLGSISVFFIKEKWKITALLTCIFLQFFPNSMIYNLLYMIVPLVLFLIEENKSRFDYVYIVLFFFCMVPFPYVVYDIYQNLQMSGGCNITCGFLFSCIALISMTFLITGGGIRDAIRSGAADETNIRGKTSVSKRGTIMKNKEIKKTKARNRIVRKSNFYMILLSALICIYHLFYVRSTIPAQIGWWHYFGWRLNEGDILYKDIYCHVQPFFPWLMGILYKLFGSGFIYYVIPGLLIRIVETLLVYRILLRFAKPEVSAFASFVAIIFTSSAVYDIVFDFNTTVLFLTVLNAYIFVKFYDYYDDEKKKNLYCILSGLIAGIHFLTKQNTGTIVSFSIFVLLIIITVKKDGKGKLVSNIIRFLAGTFIILLPAFVYILMTKSFPDYIHCIIFGMSSKGSMTNKMGNIIHNMINPYDVINVITVLFIMYLRRYKFHVSEKLYFMINAYFFIILGWCLYERFGYVSEGLQKIFKTAPEFYVTTLLLTLLWELMKIIKNRKRGFYVNEIFIIGTFTLVLFYWFGRSEAFHRTIFYSLDFQNMRTYFIYMIHYFFFFFWIKKTWQIIRKKAQMEADYIFNTIIIALYCSCLLSSTPEELFVLPASAYVFVQLFNRKMEFNIAKKTILVYCSIAFVLLCASQKMFRPYEWYGWTDAAVERENLIPSEVDGLQGFLLPASTEEKYELIVNAVMENSTEEDVVYQFPTLTLFNVLTHRKVPTYMPVHYFDVCSDEVAIADAEYLTNNPPKIVIWYELSEISWLAHEQLFRSGQRSGQRALQNFYYTTVHEKYSMEVSVDNNQGGTIEVWVLNE